MKTNQEIAAEIIAGKWGNGAERRQKLEAAGYNYMSVQSIVNAIMSGQQQTAAPAPAVPQTRKTLSVDYDPAEYEGIEINILY